MKSTIVPFFIRSEIKPFPPLVAINIGDESHYKISDIADLGGKINLYICGWSATGDAPVLNLIEVSEFLYGLACSTGQPVALTIDMEPVLYGWRQSDVILVTNFKTKESKFGEHDNVLGQLTASQLGAAAAETADEIAKVAQCDPILFVYLLGRMYRSSATQNGNS